jgi:hypothetical protein
MSFNISQHEDFCLAMKQNGMLCGNRAQNYSGHTIKVSCGINSHIEQCRHLTQDDISVRQLALEDDYIMGRLAGVEATVRIIRNLQDILRVRINHREPPPPPPPFFGFQPSFSQHFSSPPSSSPLQPSLFQPLQPSLFQPLQPSLFQNFLNNPIIPSPPPSYSNDFALFFLPPEYEEYEDEVAVLPEPKKFSELQAEEREKNPFCGVCFENYRDDTKVCVTDCGHSFCEVCLGRWVNDERKTTCPMCRNSLVPSDQ